MAIRMSLAAGVAAMSLIAVSGPSRAESQQTKQSGQTTAGHSYEMAMIHGGQVSMTEQHHFEVLFTDTQARVYVYDANQKPIIDPKDVKVTMTLTGKDGKAEAKDLKYKGPAPDKGRTHGYFYLDRDMSTVKDGDMIATVKVMDLEENPIEIRTPVTRVQLTTYACPMNDSGVSEDPGKCPKCGMQMTKVGQGEPMKMMDSKSSGHSGS